MNIFEVDPATILRIAITAVIVYVVVVVLLRIAGKRTLADMNAFDFVVNVALGSILATTIVSGSTPLLEGVTALVVLVALQSLIAYLAVRFKTVSAAIKSEPTLVVHRGVMLPAALREARLTEADVLQAVRSAGEASLGSVHAVVLESNGELSVIGSAPPTSGGGAMQPVPAAQ